MTCDIGREDQPGLLNTQAKPKKSVRRASLGILIPSTTVWRVARKRLVIKLYKLQLVPATTADETQKRKQFWVDMQDKLKEEEFYERLVFVMRPHFKRKAKAICIIFAFGAKMITMPL